MPNEEQIILVDEDDVQIGTMGKLETHEKGLLHRAFSILVFNTQGELMLQKRALLKKNSRFKMKRKIIKIVGDAPWVVLFVK